MDGGIKGLASVGFLDLLLSQNGFFVWLPLLVIFSFKVRRGNEVGVCFVAGSGLCPPASSNWLSISGGGLCGSCTPNVEGPQSAPVSCVSIFFRNGVAENRVLVAANSRKVGETLPVDLCKLRLFGD